MTEIEIEINGKKLTAKPNETIIQVADAAGIYIPRFCYHKHLSIAANCRMCLVEVEKSPKALPACATPVMPGMKVFTESQKTIDAQRAVMEFLLINHPLDCPVCDQGGECELQDLSMGYGSSHSHYDEAKRAMPDLDLGPLIATEMTRCIYCTRCVRFGDEVAGKRELGGTERGENTEIGTYIKHAVQSEVSGNVIDLCPVGALTAKPSRFTGRAWEYQQHSGVSPHDSLGSHLSIHTKSGKVMRVVPRENPTLNQTWLSDRDRFSYAGIYHSKRLMTPRAKINGEWCEIDWETAFAKIAEKLISIKQVVGGEAIGALASPNSTLEEFYLLQKIMQGLDSHNVDCRLRQSAAYEEEISVFSLDELLNASVILLIGTDLISENPLLTVRLRDAVKRGKQVLFINARDLEANLFKLTAKAICAPHHFAQFLTTLLAALNSDTVSEKNVALFKAFLQSSDVHILVGAQIERHPERVVLRQTIKQMADLIKAKVSVLTNGANEQGALLSGALPHRDVDGALREMPGLTVDQMLKTPRHAYLLMNVEPDDCVNPHLLQKALKKADFVAALALYENEFLMSHADVLLPMTSFAETAGTYLNLMGEAHTVQGIATPVGASRPAWKILRVLGNFLNLSGFQYDSSAEIKAAIPAQLTPSLHTVPFEKAKKIASTENSSLSRIGDVPLYAVDSLVRHSEPLQKMQAILLGDTLHARIHSKTALRLQLMDHEIVQLSQEEATIQIPIHFDDTIAEEAIWLPSTVLLGELYGAIHIKKTMA